MKKKGKSVKRRERERAMAEPEFVRDVRIEEERCDESRRGQTRSERVQSKERERERERESENSSKRSESLDLYQTALDD
jgi:hypothetical protein